MGKVTCRHGKGALKEHSTDSNKLLRDTWGHSAYTINSDLGRDCAIEVIEEGGLVSFARHFISNVSK